jgi:hypothetical protein
LLILQHCGQATMSTDPDVVEFELRFRAPNVTSSKQLGNSVYQGVEETAVAPEFFRTFLNDLHRSDTETHLSTTWKFSGNVTMEGLCTIYRKFYMLIPVYEFTGYQFF